MKGNYDGSEVENKERKSIWARNIGKKEAVFIILAFLASLFLFGAFWFGSALIASLFVLFVIAFNVWSLRDKAIPKYKGYSLASRVVVQTVGILVIMILLLAGGSTLPSPPPKPQEPPQKVSSEATASAKNVKGQDTKGAKAVKETKKEVKKVVSDSCISSDFALAKEFKLVGSEDISYKPKPFPDATIEEIMLVKQTALKRVYRIVVPENIDLASLKATIGKILADQQKNEPDVDEATTFVYDREQDAANVGYTVGSFTWGFGGELGKISPEIAESNKRAGYKVTCDIKARIKLGAKAEAKRPTAKEFEIYDDWNNRVNSLEDQGVYNIDDNAVEAEVAKKYGISAKEVADIVTKVLIWHAGGN